MRNLDDADAEEIPAESKPEPPKDCLRCFQGTAASATAVAALAGVLFEGGRELFLPIIIQWNMNIYL